MCVCMCLGVSGGGGGGGGEILAVLSVHSTVLGWGIVCVCARVFVCVLLACM